MRVQNNYKKYSACLIYFSKERDYIIKGVAIDPLFGL